MKTAIVIPMWNEEDWIIPAYEQLTEKLKSLNMEATIVFATDGCTDNTVKIIQDLIKENPELIHFNDPQKLGRGLALKKVIKDLDSEYIIYMDSDLATDLDHLEDLMEYLEEGADIVTGSRLMKGATCERSSKRDFFSKIYNLLARVLFQSKLKDHQCGFKGFKRESILKILDDIKDTGWFWDTELLIKGQKEGFKIVEFPIRWTDRDEEASKVNVVNDAKSMGKSLFKLRYDMLPETYKQIIKFGIIGISNTLISMLILFILDNTSGRGEYGYYIAYLVGGLNSFILNRRYTFNEKKVTKKTPIQLILFIGLVFASMEIYSLTASFLEDKLNFHYLLAAIGAAIVNFIVQFIVSKLAIFRKKKINPNDLQNES